MTEKNKEAVKDEASPTESVGQNGEPIESKPRHLTDGLNTDGRAFAKWESNYPPEAWKQIRCEQWYVVGVLCVGLVGLLLIWNGALFDLLHGGCVNSGSRASFNKFSLFFFGGLLGGSLFGIKYFYKVVGRGYWNEDRWPWRFLSPLVSGGLALAVGAMVDSGILGLTIKTTTQASFLAMGFLTGYFADSALAKMQDVADTVFGSARRDSPPRGNG